MALDLDLFTSSLRKHAEKMSTHSCAKYVREALEAGGADCTGHPETARLWGPILLRIGYHPITVETPEQFTFTKGDVVIFQPYRGGNPAGHIAGFDGAHWISDFVQSGFWPGIGYRKANAEHVVYRF
jgi:hypothetical protein